MTLHATSGQDIAVNAAACSVEKQADFVEANQTIATYEVQNQDGVLQLDIAAYQGLVDDNNKTLPIVYQGKCIGSMSFDEDSVRIDVSDTEHDIKIQSTTAFDNIAINSHANVNIGSLRVHGRLSVDAKNVEITEALSVTDICLQAQALVKVSQDITASSFVQIAAKEVELSHKLKSLVTKIQAHERLTQHGELLTEILCAINTKEMHEHGRIKAHGKLKITSDNYAISEDARCKSRGKMKITSRALANRGYLKSKNKSHIKVDNFDNHAKLKLNNEAQVETKNFHGHQGSLLSAKIKSDNLLKEDRSYVQTYQNQENFIIDENAKMLLNQVKLHSDDMILRGHCSLTGSRLESELLDVDGSAQLAASDVQVIGVMTVGTTGELHVGDSRLTAGITDMQGQLVSRRSELASQISAKFKGKANVVNTKVSADYIELTAEMTSENSGFIARKALRQAATARLNAAKSVISTPFADLKGDSSVKDGAFFSDKIHVSGSLTLSERAYIGTDELLSSHDATLDVNQSYICAKESTQLEGTSTFNDSRLHTKQMSLTEGSDSTFVKTDLLSIRPNYLVQKREEPMVAFSAAGKLHFSEGRLFANTMDLANDYTVERAAVAADTLTESGVGFIHHTTVGADIHRTREDSTRTSEGSRFISQYSHLAGKLNLSHSEVTTAVMSQEKGEIDAKQSTFNIYSSIETRDGSTLNLSENSTLVGHASDTHDQVTGLLNGETRVNKSVIGMTQLSVAQAHLSDSKMTAGALHVDTLTAERSGIEAYTSMAVSQQLQVKEASHIKAQQLKMLADSKLDVAQSQVQVRDELVVFGNMDVSAQSEISAGGMKAYQSVQVTDRSKLTIEGDLSFGRSSDVALEDSHVHADNIQVSNKLKVNKAHKRSRENKYEKDRAVISAKQNLSINAGAEVEANNTYFAAGKNIDFAVTTKATGDSVMFKSDGFDHSGEMVINDLTIDTDYFSTNNGNIDGGSQLQITADKTLTHIGGRIGANKLTINSGLTLNVGHMVGYDSFDLNTLVSLNSGLYRSYNFTANSVVNASPGFILPSSPSSKMAIFSKQHLKSVSKAALNLIFPSMSSYINLGFAAAPLAESAVTTAWQAGKVSLRKLSMDGFAVSDIVLMTTLPADQKPKKETLYLEKCGDQIKYKVIAPDEKTVTGYIDICVDGELTAAVIGKLKPQILAAVGEKGHIGKESYRSLLPQQFEYVYKRLHDSSDDKPLSWHETMGKLRVTDVLPSVLAVKNLYTSAKAVYDADLKRRDDLEKEKEKGGFVDRLRSDIGAVRATMPSIDAARESFNHISLNKLTSAMPSRETIHEAAVSRWSNMSRDTATSGIDWLATTFGPSINQSSLLTANLGVEASVNVMHSDYLAWNHGVMAANTLIHNGSTINNHGAALGRHVIMTGKTLNNSGYIANSRSMHLTFDTIDVRQGATLDGHQAIIKATKLNDQGDVRLEKSALEVTSFDVRQGATLDGQQVTIKAGTLNDQGAVRLEKSELEVTSLVVGGENNHDANLQAFQTRSKVGTIDNHGDTLISGLTKQESIAARETNAPRATSTQTNTTQAEASTASTSTQTQEQQAKSRTPVDKTKAQTYNSRLEVDRITNHEGGRLAIEHTWTDATHIINAGTTEVSHSYMQGADIHNQGPAAQMGMSDTITRHETITNDVGASLSGQRVQMTADRLNNQGDGTFTESSLLINKLQVGSADNHVATLAAYKTQSKVDTVDNYGKTRITGLSQAEAKTADARKQEDMEQLQPVVGEKLDIVDKIAKTSNGHIAHDTAASEQQTPEEKQVESPAPVDRTKAEAYSSRLEADSITNHEGGTLTLEHTWTDATHITNAGTSEVSQSYMQGADIHNQGPAARMDLRDTITRHQTITNDAGASLCGQRVQMTADHLNNQGSGTFTESSLVINKLQVGSEDNHAATLTAYKTKSKLGTVSNHGKTRITGLSQAEAEAADARKAEEALHGKPKTKPIATTENNTQTDNQEKTTESGESKDSKPTIDRTKAENYDSTLVVDSIKNHEGGSLTIEHTHVEAKEDFANDGKTTISHSHVQGRSVTSTSATSDFEAHSSSFTLTEELRLSQGQAQLNHVEADAKNVHLSAALNLQTNNTVIRANQLHQASNITMEGYLGLRARENVVLAETSRINAIEKNKTDVLDISGPAGELYGQISTGVLQTDVANFREVEQLIRGVGRYHLWDARHGLSVTTTRGIDLHEPIHRSCSLDLTAHSIDFRTDYQHQGIGIRLKSTHGKIHAFSNLSGDYVHLDAATNLYTSRHVVGQKQTYLAAGGDYHNLGGDIRGQEIIIRGQGVFNYTAGSAAARCLGEYRDHVGGGGSVVGRDVYVDATHTNIENHGGRFQGERYLQMVANQNIVVRANEQSFRGKHDTQKAYTSGYILGGTGIDDQSLGLYIKAGGQVLNYGSTIGGSSRGYIEATHGLRSEALSHTFLDKKKTRTDWKGSKKTKKSTATTVHHASYDFRQGGLHIYAPEGGLYAVGTHFLTRDGTHANVRDNIELYSLITKDKTSTRKQSLFGLNRSSTKTSSERAAPTIIADNGTTILKSTEGSIKSRGTAVLGHGDFVTSAVNGEVDFSQDILQHHIRSRSSGFSVSLPALDALRSKAEQGPMGFVMGADPSLGKVDALLHSHTANETLANSANLAIAGYNSAQQWAHDLAHMSPGEMFLDRSGLAALADPVVNLTYTESKTDTRFQTTGQGAVRRGSWKVDAKTAIIDGIVVDIEKDMHVKAQKLEVSAPELKSSSKHQTISASVGVSASGDVVSASGSVDKTSQKATQIQEHNVNVGGNLHLDVAEADINSSHINADTVTGNIDKLNVTSLQDTQKTKALHTSASTHGQFALQQSQSSSAVTNQIASIHARQGLNHDAEHQLKIGKLNNTGGTITTDGVNLLAADEVNNHTVRDHAHSSSLGASGNVKDLTKPFENKSDTNLDTQATEPSQIQTATISMGREDYRAKHKATYHGAKGTALQFGVTSGDEMHTKSANGSQVTKDKREHIHVDVPVVNPSAFFKPAKLNVPVQPPSSSHVVDLTDEIPVAQSSDANQADNESPVNDEPTNLFAPNMISNEADYGPLAAASTSNDDISSWDQAALLAGQQAMLTKAAANVIRDYQRHGVVSEEVKDAFVTILKTGTEAGWDAIVNCMAPECQARFMAMLSDPKTRGQLIPQISMKGGGILLTFGMNAALNRNSPNILQDAAKATLGDVVFNISLKKVAGGASGPIGLAWSGLTIIDTLLYDEPAVNQRLRQCEQDLEAMAKASYCLPSHSEYRAAIDELDMLADAQMVHMVAQAPGKVGDAICGAASAVADGVSALYRHCTEPSPAPAAISPTASSFGQTQQSLFQPVKAEQSQPSTAASVPTIQY